MSGLFVSRWMFASLQLPALAIGGGSGGGSGMFAG